MSNEHKGIKSAEAAARIRAILREYLGPELPDAVSIWDTGGVEKPPGIRWRADYMYIELKADKQL